MAHEAYLDSVGLATEDKRNGLIQITEEDEKLEQA